MVTEDEEEIIKELTEGAGLGYPKPIEKFNVHSFLNKVLKAKDRLVVSNLETAELKAVRVLRNAANYADTMGLDKVSEYLKAKSEIILGSADSKKGFLINAAITSKKQLETKQRSGIIDEKGGFKWGKKKQE
jgi:hypothetical protein